MTFIKHNACSHKTNSTLLIQWPALHCRLYGKVKSRMNVLEGECSLLHLFEISVNANIVVYIYYCSVVCVFCLHSFLQSCLCIFVYLFGIFFMLVFVVILSCSIIFKQACLLHCFFFVTFVYNFNVKRCKCKTPAPRFVIFITICPKYQMLLTLQCFQWSTCWWHLLCVYSLKSPTSIFQENYKASRIVLCSLNIQQRLQQ